ncbi:MAG: peptide chain release factor N(5)-glutamine methyltransferase [Desulfovibrio sp.]|nr:peptide chain release factor N(5)-glutamine methyltransferase [Desulfovibrio sp.]
MRLGDYLETAVALLKRAGVDSPRLSAEVLVREALCRLESESDWSARLFCIMEAGRTLTAEEVVQLDSLMARRAKGCPVAQIVGHKEFYGREFLVTQHTLIPRPETELVVECALLLVKEACCFADMGSGSGCIGLTLAAERLDWHGLLLDASTAALGTAAANCVRLGLAQRVRVVAGDMFQAPLRPNSLDLLVSNPPYIGISERHSVMAEVLEYEPEGALFSGHDGLKHLAAVMRVAAMTLKPGGWIVLEHGAYQGRDVRQMLVAGDIFDNVQTQRDLAGHERCSWGRKRTATPNE